MQAKAHKHSGPGWTTSQGLFKSAWSEYAPASQQARAKKLPRSRCERLGLHLRMLQGFGNPPFFKIIHYARQCGFYALKPPLHHRKGLGHKQKGVGLLRIKYFLDAIVQFCALFLIGRGLRLFKQLVHPGIAVVGKIQPALKGLG